MKIVLLNNLFGRNIRGGAEKVVARQFEERVKAGDEVYVLASESFHGLKSLIPHHDSQDPQDVYRLFPLNFSAYENLNKVPYGLRFLWHFFDIFNLHSAFVTYFWLNKINPDLVITHNLTGLGWLILKVINSKWTHHLHDIQLLHPSGLLLSGEENSKKYQGWLAKTYRGIMRYLIGQPEDVIAPSQWIVNEHQKFGFFHKSKITILKHPDFVVPLNIIKDGQAVNLLYLGQFEEFKGIIFLIKTLKSTQLKFILHIVGGGSAEKQIQELCAGDNRFVIYPWQNDLEPTWQKTDLLIVPSLCYENFPNVLSEALSHNVPVLASSIGGIPEIIKPAINGWLFIPGDQTDLLKNLNNIL